MARTELGREIEAGLREAIAHSRGEIYLETRVASAMQAARVREIRKGVAKSPKDFESRFGVPARTLEGWEHGRKVDATARALLLVIASDPEVVERAVRRSVDVGDV